MACVLQSGIEMPYRAIQTNIAEALNIVIQIERQPGIRFVSEIVSIERYEPENGCYDLQLIYQR
jgi:Flp pilus assembly CpaF family ATPase